MIVHVGRGSLAHDTAAVPNRCLPLTSEVRVDGNGGTGKVVVTVSRKSGSSDHGISRVRERDVSPLHLASRSQTTNDSATSRDARGQIDELVSGVCRNKMKFF